MCQSNFHILSEQNFHLNILANQHVSNNADNLFFFAAFALYKTASTASTTVDGIYVGSKPYC